VSSRDFGNAREPATRWRSGCCRVACAVFKAAASASIISFCAVRLCLRLRRPVCGLGGCCAVGVTGARSVWSRGATCGRLGVCRCCQEHPERSKNRITRDAEPEYFHFSAPLPAAELVGDLRCFQQHLNILKLNAYKRNSRHSSVVAHTLPVPIASLTPGLTCHKYASAVASFP